MQDKKQNLGWVGNIHAEVRDAAGRVVRTYEEKNIVVYAGLEKMLQRLAAEEESGEDTHINIAALGTGGGTPTTADEGLTTEVYRNAVVSATAADNKLFIDALYEAAEVDGTFSEFGLFLDGDDGTPGSGTLWNRVLVSWVKSSSESLFVRSTFTLTNI